MQLNTSNKNQFFSKSVSLIAIRVLLVGIIMHFACMAYSQGSLILLQKRIVFNAGDNIKVIDYGNTGNESAEYEASLINMRMNPNGTFETITVPDSGASFASDNIQFYPRTMVIHPGESQTMKVQLVNSENMNLGEYRSHLYFRAKPESNTDYETNDSQSGSQMDVRIKTEYGIVIPVIVRIGESTTAVNISNIKLSNEGSSPVVHFSIERSGNFSCYGHISVKHIADDAKETEIGSAKGVAVYLPLSVRNCAVNLNSESINLSKGTLRISYSLPAEEGGAIFCQSEIKLSVINR